MADLLPDWASGILETLTTDTGFDLSGVANAFLGGGSSRQPQIASGFSGNIGGPGGITVQTGGGIVPSYPGFPRLDNPTSPLPGLGGGPVPPGAPGGGSYGISYHSIRDKMFAHLGFRPRRKTVMYLIRTLGFAIASAVLGLDINDVLFLFMKRRHGSRRHYVQTMIKWVKRGERARHTLGKYKVPHARRGAAPRSRGRRRRAA